MNLPIVGDTNKFAKFFRFGRINDDNIKDDTEKTMNSRGMSQEQIDFGNASYWNHGVGDSSNSYGMSSIGIQFEQYFRTKATRIFKYREMSTYPDINDGLDMICDEAMVEDTSGNYVALKLKDEVPEHIEDQLRDYWDYLINDVFMLNDTGWELFRRWIIDGELYCELILNDDGDNVIDYKILPATTMSAIYDDSDVIGYIQQPYNLYGTANVGADGMGQSEDSPQGYDNDTSDDNGGLDDEVRFDKDQIVYANYGYTGRNKLDVRGFLDSSIKVYNQLKHLEDAVVVYRIVRAPERRIWNVGVGRMPKGRAEQYIRHLIQRYRKNVHYDPQSGAMDSSKNFQAMTDDFWFAKDENGEGTTVQTLDGGQNLGEMDDIYYFERKLHQNMKVPSNRWNNGGEGSADVYSTGKGNEITREEIKFARFVNRLQKRFSVMFMESFLTLLRLNGFDDNYIDSTLFNIQFTQSNLWQQYKELEVLEARFGILGAIETYIYKPEENDNAPFSMEFVLRNWFLMSDEEYMANKELLDKEKEAARINQQQMGFGADEEGGEEGGFGGEGGGDFGGDGGFGGEEGEGGEEGGFGEEPAGGGVDAFGATDGAVGEFDQA